MVTAALAIAITAEIGVLGLIAAFAVIRVKQWGGSMSIKKQKMVKATEWCRQRKYKLIAALPYAFTYKTADGIVMMTHYDEIEWIFFKTCLV